MLAGVLVCAACGARSDIDELAPAAPVGVTADASAVEASSVVDASVVVDASFADVPRFVSDGPPAAEPDAACSTPTVDVTECQPGNPTCCKFYITWACGDVTYGLGGGCGPLNGPTPTANYGCFVDGQWGFTSTHVTHVSSCACDDSSALAAFAEAHCGP